MKKEFLEILKIPVRPKFRRKVSGSFFLSFFVSSPTITLSLVSPSGGVVAGLLLLLLVVVVDDYVIGRDRHDGVVRSILTLKVLIIFDFLYHVVLLLLLLLLMLLYTHFCQPNAVRL